MHCSPYCLVFAGAMPAQIAYHALSFERHSNKDLIVTVAYRQPCRFIAAGDPAHARFKHIISHSREGKRSEKDCTSSLG